MKYLAYTCYIIRKIYLKEIEAKKHHYKHPTPPDATSLKQEEGNTDNDSPQLTQITETKTRRMLRSNSTLIN